MEEYIGMIKLFGGPTAPNGWMFCQGQPLEITANPALYSILGTRYGGDGKTNFCLPDLRGRMPVGAGTGNGLTPVTVAETGGSANATLNAANIPPHTHNVTGSVQLMMVDLPANIPSPVGNYPAQTGDNTYSTAPGAEFSGGLEVNLAAGASGSTSQFSVMPPYTGVNFMICVNGFFPQSNS